MLGCQVKSHSLPEQLETSLNKHNKPPKLFIKPSCPRTIPARGIMPVTSIPKKKTAVFFLGMDSTEKSRLSVPQATGPRDMGPRARGPVGLTGDSSRRNPFQKKNSWLFFWNGRDREDSTGPRAHRPVGPCPTLLGGIHSKKKNRWLFFGMDVTGRIPFQKKKHFFLKNP